jgi:hypothetical protein
VNGKARPAFNYKFCLVFQFKFVFAFQQHKLAKTLAAIGICLRCVASRGAAQAHRTFATPSRTNANCSAFHRTVRPHALPTIFRCFFEFLARKHTLQVPVIAVFIKPFEAIIFPRRVFKIYNFQFSLFMLVR